MKRASKKYVVGNLPPRNLSPKAKAQLKKGHRSKAMEEMVERASRAEVTFQLDKAYFLSLLASDPPTRKRS